jgi:hypothetical protein
MARAGRTLSVMRGLRRFIGLSVPHRTLYFRTPSAPLDKAAFDEVYIRHGAGVAQW